MNPVVCMGNKLVNVLTKFLTQDQKLTMFLKIVKNVVYVLKNFVFTSYNSWMENTIKRWFKNDTFMVLSSKIHIKDTVKLKWKNDTLDISNCF